MPIKISITIELITWPRRRVPLGLWSRVRTQIRRKYEGSHHSSWTFLENETMEIAAGELDQPPPYIGPCRLPAIMVTPSTPDDCEDFSAYEFRTQMAAPGSDVVLQTESTGA